MLVRMQTFTEATGFLRGTEFNDEMMIEWSEDRPFGVSFTGAGLDDYEISFPLLQQSINTIVETNDEVIFFDDDWFRVLVKDGDDSVLVFIPATELSEFIEEVLEQSFPVSDLLDLDSVMGEAFEEEDE